MRKFWLDCVIATAFVFLAMWGIFGLTQLRIFDAFDTIGTALADVELTDYVFSGIRDDPSVDTTVTLINIGRLSRRDIAKRWAIECISQPHRAIKKDIDSNHPWIIFVDDLDFLGNFPST